MEQFFKKRPHGGNTLAQQKVIIDPPQKSREPLASEQLVNEGHLFALFAVKIINDPVTNGTFRANLSGIAFDAVMLSNLVQ